MFLDVRAAPHAPPNRAVWSSVCHRR